MCFKFSRYSLDIIKVQYNLRELSTKLMNMETIIDGLPLPCLSYELIVIPDQQIIFGGYRPFFISQNPHYFEPLPSTSVLKDHFEEFHSKSFNSIVLTSEDIMEHEEAHTNQTSSYNSHFNHLKYLKRHNRKQNGQKTFIFKNEDTNSKETLQKESRNTYSNLLRIFMRNTLQGGVYDDLIERITKAKNYSFSVEEFYSWFYSFRINFKNYIRFKQLAQIFSSDNAIEYQNTLKLLLRSFFNEYCMAHCLTSRKITGKGRKMHLQGARSLERALRSLVYPRG